MNKFILAVDIDDTIIKKEKDYVPRVLLPGSKEVLNWAKDKGCYIIIWTCRYGDMLKQALDFIDKQGIKYDIVNNNAPWLEIETSRKIFYDLLIDDRALGFTIDWENIKQLIRKEIIKNLVNEIIKVFK